MTCRNTENVTELRKLLLYNLLFCLNAFLIDFTLSNLGFLYFNCNMLDKTNVV